MRVAITGGTGTLGRALIRRLLDTHAERVVSFSRDEVKAGDLTATYPEAPNLRIFLGDVRDRERLVQAFRGCETVVHAAALKRITESVYSPGELIKTNITGTVNVIHAAAEAGVGRVLMVSSDKCVSATNLYGMTKAVAESYAVQSNSYVYARGTRVAALRYGNVVGSRGSVLEVWAKAQRDGAPLPITHPAMTRFLITQAQAVQCVLDALELMQGGEVFIPALPMARLLDLADAVAPGHPTRLTGLRPGGEKIHERLISDEEEDRLWRAPNGLFVVLPSHRSWSSEEYPYAPSRLARPYTSEYAERLTMEELRQMVKEAGCGPL